MEKAIQKNAVCRLQIDNNNNKKLDFEVIKINSIYKTFARSKMAFSEIGKRNEKYLVLEKLRVFNCDAKRKTTK